MEAKYGDTHSLGRDVKVLQILMLFSAYAIWNSLAFFVCYGLYNDTNTRDNAAAPLFSPADTVDHPIDKKLIVSATQLLQFLLMDSNIQI